MKKTLIVSLLLLALCVSLTACFGAVSNKTAAELLEAYGLKEDDLKPHAGDLIALEIKDKEEKRDGDFYLRSAASFEEVQQTVYDACKKASDDGIVRDFMTEDPVEFAYGGDAEIVWFGYRHGEDFCHVAVSVYSSDPAIVEAFVAAEAAETTAATEAATEAAAEASTEAPTEAETEASAEAEVEAEAEDAVLTVYLIQWD